MMTSFGDLARGLLLQRQTGAIKAEVHRLSGELATGRTGDPARRLRGDITAAAAVENGLARASALRDAAATGLRRATAMQAGIRSLGEGADSVFRDILGLGPQPSAASVSGLASEARGRFDDAVAILRSSSGGRALFGGAAIDGPPVATAEQILAAVDAAVLSAGATSAEAIAATIVAWFDDPAGFAAAGYLGSGDPEGPIPTAAGATVALTVTALDPGVRRTLAALAIASRAGDPALPQGAGAALLRAAAPAFAAASDARIAAAETLGRAERRLAEAVAARAAEVTALSVMREELLAADPYETAAALEAAQRQVETLYAVTARLARLSLADVLR